VYSICRSRLVARFSVFEPKAQPSEIVIP
jgi:hypothetical protein